jgi:hypothetical protein
VSRELRSRRWYVAIVSLTVAAMAGTLAAIVVGGNGARLWPIATFLMLAVASVGYNHVAARARRRVAYRLRHGTIPRGVRLTKPFWMRIDDVVTVISVAAVIAAMVAVGFPQVAVGLLAVVGIGFVVTEFAAFGVKAVMFDSEGVRLYVGAAHCLVPWRSIRTVDTLGPDHFQLVSLGVDDLDGVRASVSPDTARSRKRVQSSLGPLGARSDVMLSPWTAGLDSQTLLRAIRDGIAGAPEKLN